MEYKLIEPKIKLSLSPIERVLTNRGIGLANVKHYLNTTDEDIINYEQIDNILDGV